MSTDYYAQGYQMALGHSSCLDDARLWDAIRRYQIHRSRTKNARQHDHTSGVIDGYSDVMIVRRGHVQWGVRA